MSINFSLKKFMKRSCAAREDPSNLYPACPIDPEDRIGVKFFGKDSEADLTGAIDSIDSTAERGARSGELGAEK